MLLRLYTNYAQTFEMSLRKCGSWKYAVVYNKHIDDHLHLSDF